MFANIVGRRTTALATTLAVVVGLAITPAFTATAAEGDEPIVAEQVAVVEEAPAPVVEPEAPEVPVAPVTTVEEPAVLPAPAPVTELVEAPATEDESQAQSPIAPLAGRMAGPAAESEPVAVSTLVAPAATQSIQPSAIGPFVVNQPVNGVQFTYPGTDRWVVSGLPSGLSLNQNNGKLTGKATTAGAYTIEVTAQGTYWFGWYYYDLESKTYDVTVSNPAPVINTNSLPGATVDVAYTQQLSASNGPNTFTISQGSLPAGLTLSASGLISSTPTFVDGYDGSDKITFSVIANNGTNSAAKQLSITVATPAPAFGNTPLAVATVGAQYTQALPLASGYGTLTYSLNSGSLPNGLTLGADGVISGTPMYDGSYSPTQVFNFNARVSGPTGVQNQPFELTLQVTAPAITTTTLPVVWLTETYNQAITTTGSGVALSATGLPTGLNVVGTSSNGYSITGMPQASGAFPVQLTASNVGGTAAVTLTLTVNPAPAFVTTSPLQNAVVGSAYSSTIAATGPAVAFALVSAPAGMVIDAATGELSGWTPTAESNVTVRVSAENRSGIVERDFIIKPFAVPTIATTVLDSGKVGKSYSDQIVFDGRNAKIQKTAGTLPKGVSLKQADGTLSGTPTKAGVFTFTVTVTNNAGTATANYEIRIHDVPVIHVTNLKRAIVGQAYTDSVQFSGLDAEATITRGVLPAGMTLNTDGTFSGAPTETGAFGFTVKVSNPAGSVQHRYRIVSVDVPVFQTASLNHGIVGMAYSQQLAVDGFDLRFAVPRTSTLPAGLTLERNGLLHGTPTVAGDFTFDVRARNAAGVTVQNFTLTVTQPAATLSTTSVIRGNTVTVSGSGYLPGDDLELWLHSTPVLLGTVTATNGTFTSTVVIPANTEAGAHHLFVQGTHSGTQSVPLTVALPAPAPQQPQSSTQARSPQLTVTPADTTLEVTEVTSDDPAADEVEEADEDLPTLNKPVAEGETTAAVPADWSGLIMAAFVLLLAALLVWFLLWRRRRAAES